MPRHGHPPASPGKPVVSFELCIFDLDGVLVDSKMAWMTLLNAALDHFGGIPLDDRAFANVWGQGMDADRRMFFPALSRDELRNWYVAHFPQYAPLVRLLPGVNDTLEGLSRSGRILAVASNSPIGIVEEILAHHRIREFFRVVVGGDQVARPKPDAAMILRILSVLGVSPDRAVMAGDSVYDRMAAQAAEVLFAGVGIEGDITIPTLADLPIPADGPPAS